MKKLMTLALALLLVGCSTSTNTAENDTANADNTFTVGMECDYAPFNWTQVDANETAVKISDVDYCDGYDVVIAKRIADELGKELEIKKVSWDNLIIATNQGDIDAIIAGMTDTPQRREEVDFTNPYYESQMVVIVREDSELANITDIQELSGYKVMGQIATLYDEIIDQIDGVQHMTPQDSYPRMVLALNEGEVDAITAELPVAQGVVAANEGLKIVSFEEGHGFEADTSVSIALAKNSELLEPINQILDGISQEERNQMMIDATNRQPAAQ
ncbi:MAG: transporter substrate-binding domain-containing protein [Erysipelotrichaceae bacterium]|nr:transporter substrate-binding domain-containing protein [Erysipelotrichaceae bacterium]MDY5251324.1 transporter substrate-binding domain-containing protein [Erysipelotrichaceae bacterium]